MSEWKKLADVRPVTGKPCLIVWADTVQHMAYCLSGKGFACEEGYEWRDMADNFDPIPMDEVTDWQYLPEFDRFAKELV